MLPVMLNCWDWARMAVPVVVTWIRLIWKPWPVGQPEEGASTVTEPLEVRTFCCKTSLTFGYTTWWWEEIAGGARSMRTARKHGFWRGKNKNRTETNHVDQGDGEAGRIGRDGTPGDSLSVLGSIPKGTFHRARDSDAQGGGNEHKGCRESGEGTHFS